MDITPSNLSSLFKGFRTIFLAAMQGGKTMWQNFAMKTNSSSAEETYAWLGAVPGLKEMLGEIQIRNIASHGYAIANKEFESTVAVPRKTIERDKFGVYNPLMQAMGVAAAQHPDTLVADLLLNGFTSKCYTGKNFFDADHEPRKGKTRFSNKGTKKLSAANFETARANIKGRLNADGRPMNLGSDLVLIVSPTYESTGRAIVVADKAASGADNVNKGTARLEVWPQLASSEHAWFLLDCGYPVKPLIFQEELPVEFTSLNQPDSDHVFKKKEFLYQAYARGNAGYALPELAYGSTGADAA